MTTALRLEYMPLDELVPADRNAKEHDAPTMARSVDRFGFMQTPILDERTGQLVAGHGRRDDLLSRRERGERPPQYVKVGRDGVWRVPVQRGWTSASDAEALAAGVALNRVGEGLWNAEGLTAILQDLASSDLGFDGLGYGQADLEELLHAAAVKADRHKNDADPDVVPPPPAKPVTRPGDLWIMGDHRVLCGDSTKIEDVRRVLDGDPIDFAFTSPPYNVGVEYDDTDDELKWPEYLAFISAVIRNVVDELAPGRFLGWNIGAAPKTRPFDHGVLLQSLGLTFIRQLIWWKNSVPLPTYYMTRESGTTRTYYPNPTHEFVWLFSKGPAQKGGPGDYNEELLRDDVFRIQATDSTKDLWKDDQGGSVGAPGKGNLARARGNVHPAPFPVSLPQGFIGYLADRGAVVFDPFAGSGSTIIAAHRMRRRGFGIEVAPAYCDVIAERYQRVTEELPILERTGKPVDFLARRAKSSRP